MEYVLVIISGAIFTWTLIIFCLSYKKTLKLPLQNQEDMRELLAKLTLACKARCDFDPHYSASIEKIPDQDLKVVLEAVEYGHSAVKTNNLEEKINNSYSIYVNHMVRLQKLGRATPVLGLTGSIASFAYILPHLYTMEFFTVFAVASVVSVSSVLLGIVLQVFYINLWVNRFDNYITVCNERKKILLAAKDMLLQRTNPILFVESLNSYVSNDQKLVWQETVYKKSAA